MSHSDTVDPPRQHLTLVHSLPAASNPEAEKRVPSNSPLSAQTLTSLDRLNPPDQFAPYRLKVDRLTILADTTLHRDEHGELDSIQWRRFTNHPDIRGRSFAKFPYRYQFSTLSGYIAQFATPPSKVPEVRIDFNPASIRGMAASLGLLFACLRSPRVSRIDFCIDYCFDLSDWLITHSPSLNECRYIGRDGKLETVYFGSPRSGLRLRIYDKRKEHKEKTGEDLGHPLWRVEAQVRMVAGIPLHSLRPFDGLRIWQPGHGLSIQDQSMLYYLGDHWSEWGRLSRNTRSKLKALADCEDLSINLDPRPDRLFEKQFPALLERLNPVLSLIPLGNDLCNYPKEKNSENV